MATVTHTYAPILGKKFRVTRLVGECGLLPDPGEEDAFIVSEGFTSVTLSSQIEEGTEILKRNANGNLCINEKLKDSFKRFNLEIEFCGVNPTLYDFMTNAKLYRDYAGEGAGFTVGEGEFKKGFAFELWTGLTGQACEPGAEEASGYLVLPKVQAGVLGDLSVTGEAEVSFSMTGAYTLGQSLWGEGPYNVVMDGTNPAPLPTPLDALDHLLLIDTAVAPPPTADSPQPMPMYSGPVPTTTTP